MTNCFSISGKSLNSHLLGFFVLLTMDDSNAHIK